MKYLESYALEVLGYVYNSYESYFISENKELKQGVSKMLNYSFSKNKLGLIGDIPYYTLYNFQETVKYILDVDEDAIFGIVGKPGTGKSNVSFISAFYLDDDFDNSRIIFTFEELLSFLKRCAEEIKKEMTISGYKSSLRGIKIVVDEGVFMLFSADANSKEGKLATKLFTVIRFLNIVMFINITNYEKLNKTIRESRLYSVIRLLKKGRIAYYSKKKTANIKVNSENEVEWPEPNFVENVGYISKSSIFWSKYNVRKAGFVLDVVDDVIEEMENVNKKR